MLCTTSIIENNTKKYATKNKKYATKNTTYPTCFPTCFLLKYYLIRTYFNGKKTKSHLYLGHKNDMKHLTFLF